MERMTAKKDGHVYVINCPPCDVPHDVNVIIQQTADRLADIEDILCDGTGEYDLDRLRELAQADREGRCVVLPRLEPGQGDPPGELGPPGPPGIAD